MATRLETSDFGIELNRQSARQLLARFGSVQNTQSMQLNDVAKQLKRAVGLHYHPDKLVGKTLVEMARAKVIFNKCIAVAGHLSGVLAGVVFQRGARQ